MLSRRHAYLLDLLAAATLAVAGAGWVGTASESSALGAAPNLAPEWVTIGLAVIGALPVAARRRWPRTVFGVVFLAAVVSGVLGDLGVGLYAAAFALYTVAAATHRPAREPTVMIGIGTAALALLLTVGGTTSRTDLSGILLGAISLGAAWSIGRAAQARREYQEQALRRYAEQAVADDRVRIARDLHDVIAHSLSMIAVKSGVAAHVAAAQPDQARDALRTIETTSRDALSEVRRILGVLRLPDGSDGAPASTLADLPELIHGAAAGPPVRLVLGDPDDPDDALDTAALPFDVQLTAYRIVQEALTNVRRHSSAHACEVRLTRDRDQLEVEVLDDGSGLAAGEPPAGNGLRGMRERVGMYGGTLRFGNRPSGGFRVWATIPLPTTGRPT